MGKVISQKENWHSLIENLYPYEKSWDLVKVVMCALVSRVQMMFYTLRKGYTCMVLAYGFDQVSFVG